MHKGGAYGCSDIIKAINLQFELAGHGIYTDVVRSLHGYACKVVKPRRNTVTSPCGEDAHKG